MAVNNTLRKMAQQEAQMDMTPMIDVTFLILIFFMCTLHFKTLEGMLAAYLPKDQGIFSSSPKKKPEEPINIRLVKTKKETIIFVGDSELKGSKKFSKLFRKIKYIVERTPDVPAIIDPDIDVPYQDIISTLNACRKVTNVLGRKKPIEVKFAAKVIEEPQQQGTPGE